MIPESNLQHFVALKEEDGPVLTSMEILPTHLREGTISKEAIKLWDIWAATFEEASAIQNLRLGFGPYRPVGEPKLCPNGCGCHYYPLGSGDCAICGNIE